MTARLFPVPPHPQSAVRSWSSLRSTQRHPGDSAPASRASGNRSAQARVGNLEKSFISENPSLDALWNTLIESIPQGVLVVARNLRSVYTNHKAKELCQQLDSEEENTASLPAVITEVCHRLLREAENHEPIVVEYHGQQGHLIRLRVRWLLDSMATGLSLDQPYILVLLEDCYEALQEDLWIDRQKYDLTDREADIWMLLQQEYTYQEIAEILRISLNTVKTHVKNVYAKRRSSLGRRKVWYSR
jgi:PAS domain-containing protein